MNVEIRRPTGKPHLLGNRLITAKHNLYNLNIHGKKAAQLAKFLYATDNVFSMKRKRDAAFKLIKHYGV